MRLNQVIEKTGLSKRAIYFYIEKKFISPKTNPDNGYYDFTNKEVEKLNLLSKLRRADFSLKDIQAILKYPSSAYVFIEKKIKELEEEQLLLNKKISSLRDLYGKLPILTSYDILTNAVLQTEFPRDSSCGPVTADDISMVSYYLWGPFFNNTAKTEYQRYLWGRILTETAKFDAKAISALKSYLYSKSAEELDEAFRGRAEHIEQIVSLSEEQIPRFVSFAIIKIQNLIRDNQFLYNWKKNYHSYICPLTMLYDAQFNTLVSELSPWFSTYYKNIHLCCGQIYGRLRTEDNELYEKILTVLEGYINLKSDHNGQIAALFGNGKIL